VRGGCVPRRSSSSALGRFPYPFEAVPHHGVSTGARVVVRILADVNDRLLRALRREPVDRTPVWFMRQAGRYLPEYRAARGDRDILETVRDPDAAVEISMQPLRRMPLDAAIVFSDIMVPLAAVGIDVRIEAGRGPIVDAPIRSRTDLERLRPLEPESDEPYALEAIRLLRKEADVPVLGFAGAPFTLASYLVEGGPSRELLATKALLRGAPDVWDALMERLAAIVRAHLDAQIGAGAQAVQLFDSWVGALDETTYRRAVLPWTIRALEGVGVPTIHFAVASSHLWGAMREIPCDAFGVDHRVELDVAWRDLGEDRAIQGNLDPTIALAAWDVVEREADLVLERAAMREGHVFNLGHGVLPSTPVENLQRLVDLVHGRTERT
jgi:uroporphyrinogen decarboxylase